MHQLLSHAIHPSIGGNRLLRRACAASCTQLSLSEFIDGTAPIPISSFSDTLYGAYLAYSSASSFLGRTSTDRFYHFYFIHLFLLNLNFTFYFLSVFIFRRFLFLFLYLFKLLCSVFF